MYDRSGLIEKTPYDWTGAVGAWHFWHHNECPVSPISGIDEVEMRVWAITHNKPASEQDARMTHFIPASKEAVRAGEIYQGKRATILIKYQKVEDAAYLPYDHTIYPHPKDATQVLHRAIAKATRSRNDALKRAIAPIVKLHKAECLLTCSWSPIHSSIFVKDHE